MATGLVKGLAHITGGGFMIIFPDPAGETGLLITNRNWPVPPIFTMLERLGELEAAECYRVFNMGIGMVCVVAAEDRESFIAALGDEPAYCWGILARAKGLNSCEKSAQSPETPGRSGLRLRFQPAGLDRPDGRRDLAGGYRPGHQ